MRSFDYRTRVKQQLEKNLTVGLTCSCYPVSYVRVSKHLKKKKKEEENGATLSSNSQ